MTSLSHAGLKNCFVPIVLLLALCAVPGRSQTPTGTWIEIHVNGPWAYVPYSDPVSGYPEIALVIPGTDHHDPPIFLTGPHPDSNPGDYEERKIVENTLHTIEIQGLAGNCPGNPHSTRHTVNLQIRDQGRIDAVLSVTPTPQSYPVRYAIVLPKPCYTTSDPRGDSYARIDTKDVDGTTPSRRYTTWMVLHYYVAAVPFTATYDQESINFIGENGGVPSLSFVMRADKTQNEPLCDSKSLMSFVSSRDLWGITLFGQFPELDSNNHQTKTYRDDDPSCKSLHYPVNAPMAVAHHTDPGKGDQRRYSAGSGDCHHAQFNINSALP